MSTRWTALEFGRGETKARMAAFAAGVRARGGSVTKLPEGAPLSVIQEAAAGARFGFACGMPHRDAAARGYLHGMGIPLLVLDCGYFRRTSGPQDEAGYNQLGLGGLNWVPDCAVPSDRWESHGLGIAPRRRSSARHALVLGQVPGDTQHHLSEQRLSAWLTESASRLWAQGYSISFRPHPRHVISRLRVEATRIDSTTEPLAESLRTATLAVCYNSTAGLDALLAGVPVVCAPSAHFAHVADLSDPAALRLHCERLSYTQWTCAELSDGTALDWMNRFAPLLP